MNVLSIPFHEHLGIKQHEGDAYIFYLEEQAAYLNHLGNIHACVQLSLAEASSGEYLLEQLRAYSHLYIPVIRKTEVKYHKPANGTLYSKAAFADCSAESILSELVEKKRALLHIKTEIYNAENIKVLSAVFEWFIAEKPST